MSVYFVYQGITYDDERAGGFVWSPKLNKAGHKNQGFTTMTLIRKDDFILHCVNGQSERWMCSCRMRSILVMSG